MKAAKMISIMRVSVYSNTCDSTRKRLLKVIFFSKAFDPLIRLICLIRLLIRRLFVFEETEVFYGVDSPYCH